MELITLLLALAYVLGVLSAVSAIMSARTAQGSVAWVVALLTFPYLAVPAYWVFGRNKFLGYTRARQLAEQDLLAIGPEAREHSERFFAKPGDYPSDLEVVSALADLPFSEGNEVELLIDGQATFDSIFAGIERAREYILVQFYILKDDELGTELKRRLLAKRAEGVRVFVLYDEVGSYKLSRGYRNKLTAAGAEVSAFNTRQGRRNRFQINFRNHRKVVVVDGREAWVGGHNVGDEYMGRDPKFGRWRDTHVRMDGPAVLAAQLSFLEDWYWATGRQPELDWHARVSPTGSKTALVVPTSPADTRESATLLFLQAITAARERVWIASPYFVPDEAVLRALELADMRGVDVRVLIPDEPDHMLVYLAGFTFVDKLDHTGIRFYRYTDGFLHQKAALIDDEVGVVGTANLDNRSQRLNFEISVIVVDEGFAGEVEAMFEDDFSHSRLMEQGELQRRPFWFRLAARSARLTAPAL